MKPADDLRARVAQVLGRPHAEVVERRTPTSKTFDLGDGGFHVSQRRQPIHYRTGGEFREIDLAVNADLAVTAAPYTASVLSDAIGYRYESRRGGWMQMELVSLDERPVRVPKPRVAEGEVWWDDVAPGVSMLFRAGALYPEMFKQYDAPHATAWRITQSPDFPGRFDSHTKGADAAGDHLELITTYEDGVFTEAWTGRVSRIVEPSRRRKAWFNDPALPVMVDAAINEVSLTTDAGSTFISSFGTENEEQDLAGDGVAVGGFYGGANSRSTIWAGFRFQTVPLPAAATISAATLTVYKVTLNGTPSVRIYGNDVDDAAAWGGGNKIKDITKTTAFKAWTPIAPTAANSVIDVLDEVVEIAARAGWALNNDMALAMFPQGLGAVSALIQMAANAINDAQLDITYTEGGGGGSSAATRYPWA